MQQMPHLNQTIDASNTTYKPETTHAPPPWTPLPQTTEASPSTYEL